MCGNLSALIFFSCAGVGFAEQEFYNDLSNNDHGGAIYVDGDLTIEDAIFTNNSAINGGAIYVDSGGNLTLGTASFTNNYAENFGGAIYNNSNIVAIDADVFVENISSGFGGAIYNSYYGTIGDITGSAFIKNKGELYSGAICNEGTIGDFSETVFVGNYGAAAGGAIYNNGTIGDFTKTIFSLNKVETGARNYGGAVYNLDTIGSFTQTIFTRNESTNVGAAVFNIGTIKEFNQAVFSGNMVKGDYSDATLPFYGGAIYNRGTIDSIKNSIITSNVARNGGIIYNDEAGVINEITGNVFADNITAWTGGICNVGTIKNISNNIFAGNMGESSSVFFNATANGSIENITGNSFVGNKTSYWGSVILNMTNLNIGSGIFVGNRTNLNYEKYNLGGAIYNTSTLNLNLNSGEKLLFSGNLHKDNFANSIYVDGYSNSSYLNIDLAKNSILDMRDPLEGRINVSNNVEIEKTGAGTWKLGGENTFVKIGSATGKNSMNIEEGTLHLYRSGEVSNASSADFSGDVEAGFIYLAGAGSSFTLGADATLSAGGGNAIETDGTITISAGSSFAFDLGYANTGSSMIDLYAAQINIGNNIKIDLLSLNEQGTYDLLEENSTDSFVGKINTVPTLRGEEIAGSRAEGIVTISADANGIKATTNNGFNSEVINWTGTATGSDANKWNIHAENWDGTDNQFLHGDIVNFTGSGSGKVEVNADGVLVAGMYVSGAEDYIFTGGSIRADASGGTTLNGEAANGKLIIGAKATDKDTITSAEFTGTVDFTSTLENYFVEGVDFYSGTILISDASQLGTTFEKLSFNSDVAAENIATLKIAEKSNVVFASAENKDNRLEIKEGKSGKIELQEEAVFAIVGNYYEELGGAMYVAQNAEIELNAAEEAVYHFVDNFAYRGGAVYNEGLINNIDTVFFTSNKAGYEGGAIYNNNIIENIEIAVFTNNQAGDGAGGAIYNTEDGNIKNITTVVFADNLAVTYGGAIYNEGTITIGQGVFDGNRAGFLGGAIYNKGTITIGQGIFTGNDAYDSVGGAIYNTGEMIITEALFSDNHTVLEGGAIYNTGETTITKAFFSCNDTETYGGAIYNTGEITITEGSFSGNSSEWGGAIYNEGTITIGQGIFSGNSSKEGAGAIYNNHTVTIGEGVFINNSGYDAGVIFNSGHFDNGEHQSGIITITKGVFISNSVVRKGGAIGNDVFVHDGKRHLDIINITEGIFINNSAEGEGGAICNYGEITITKGIFSDNSVRQHGGAIYNNGEITITEGIFSGNYVEDYGGAIYNEREMTITEGIFSDNSSYEIAGAIYNDHTLTIGEGVFINNSGHHAGAIYNTGHFDDWEYQPGIITITKGSFISNSVTGSGGAICNISSKYDGKTYLEIINITEGIFSGNSATYGGAITNNGEITITEGIFSGNSARYGGAINNEGKTTITKGIFSDNSATYGGAINNEGKTTITEGIFSDNSSEYGGAIYNNNEMTITEGIFSDNSALFGGAILNIDGEINVTEGIFSGNSSEYGGAINNEGKTTITEGIFSSNSATGSGGAVYNEKEINMTEGLFNGNDAKHGGAIFNNGETTITEGFFSDNIAEQSGGAIYNKRTMNIGQGSFINNEAGANGGAIYNYNGTINLKLEEGQNMLFSGNLANTSTTAKASSIYFTYISKLNANLAADSILDMRDPMSGEVIADASVQIKKTGEGTWLLGGNNVFSTVGGGYAHFQVDEGTLYLYQKGEVANPNSLDPNAMVETGHIRFDDTCSSFFNIGTGSTEATLAVSVGTETNYIAANYINLGEKSNIAINYGDNFYASESEVQKHLLQFEERTSFTNESELVNPTGTLTIGAYDREVEAVWLSDDRLLALNFTGNDIFDTDRGGSHIVRAPLSIALNNPTNEVIINRQKQLFTDKTGVFGEIKQQNRHFWGTGFYNLSQMDQHHGIAGYNLKTPGFALGYDDYIGERQFLGVAVTASWPDYHGGNASADGNDIRLAVYGGAKLNHNWELSYMAGYGWANLDQDRHYRGIKYNADYDFDTLSFAVGLAKQFKRSETSFIRPYVNYEYLKIDADGYKESGSGDYRLGVDSKNYDVDRVRVGFDYVKQSKENKNRYWRAGLFWQGQYGDTTPKARAYFASNPGDSMFMSYACSEDRDSLGVTIGWGVPIGKNSDFHLSYTGLYGTKSDTQDFSMTFVRRF
ncbi:autotransporter domain-containing protein [Selenomonadales bacterium OttesenSCG-928-I06]|nr:autotransporter domain-containing protein [Selenomonadales bacterium OttesenSCG-928-I06]